MEFNPDGQMGRAEIGRSRRMTENDVEAELSYAYLHAVAARAAFGCEYAGRPSDNAGVDAYLRIRERLAPDAIHTNFPIEVQLKATSKVPALEAGRYSYWLDDVKRYNELRVRSAPMPKLLVVLFLPEDARRWLEHSEDALIARRCAYWVSLWDAPETRNRSGQTIYLPQANLLSPEGLREVARRLSREEDLTLCTVICPNSCCGGSFRRTFAGMPNRRGGGPSAVTSVRSSC
ncbi:MAG TPA: DUF4365 domain-containing protein [Gemmataceae bacterium]|nr:DUF4365 domain-containing protein [Gemmataceae bacterium]